MFSKPKIILEALAQKSRDDCLCAAVAAVTLQSEAEEEPSLENIVAGMLQESPEERSVSALVCVCVCVCVYGHQTDPQKMAGLPRFSARACP